MKSRVLPIFLLLGGLLALVPGAQAQGTLDYFEGFEPPDGFPNVPHADPSCANMVVSATCWYASNLFGAATTAWPVTTQFKNGAQSLQYDAAANSAHFSFNLNFDLCTGGSWSFWVRFEDLPAAGSLYLTLTGQANQDAPTLFDYLGLVVPSTGAAFFTIDGSGAATSSTTFTVAPDTWYDFKFDEITCSASQARFSSTTLNVVHSLDAAGTINELDVFNDADGTTAADNVPIHYLDDFTATDVSSILAAVATVAVTDLVTFDVDYTGTNLIARLDNGDDVSTYNAVTLGLVGGPEDTNCGVFVGQGVTAAQSNVAYLDCGATGPAVETLEIRSSLMGDPIVPGNCNTQEYIDNFKSWDQTGSTTSGLEIQTFEFLSIDLENEQGGACGGSAIFAVSTTTGKVYVKTLDVSRNNEENSNQIQFAPLSTAVDNLCPGTRTLDGDRTWFFVAVDQESPTKTFVWDQELSPSPTITQTASFTGSLGSALGVGCGLETPVVLIQSATKLTALDTFLGTPVWSRDSVAGPIRSVAMSADGGFGAALIDSSVHVLNMTNGETVARITPPGGTWKGIRIDAYGQNVWVATSTTISRYSTFEFTTEDPVNTDIRSPLLPTNQGPGTSDLASAGSDLGDSLGMGDTGGQVLLAVMFILLIGGFVYSEIYPSVAGFAVGCLLGLVLTIFTGIMPPIVTFLIVLGGAVFIGMRWFTGNTAAQNDGGM